AFVSFTDRSPFVVVLSHSGKTKNPAYISVSRVWKILWFFAYLLTSGLSKFVSGACPLYDMDRPRLSTQPWLNRLWRAPKVFGAGIVGQILADIFMQVLIERARRLTRRMVTVK